MSTHPPKTEKVIAVKFWQGCHKYYFTQSELRIDNHVFDQKLSSAHKFLPPKSEYQYMIREPSRKEVEKRAEYWRSQAVWRGLDTIDNLSRMEARVRLYASEPVCDKVVEMMKEMQSMYTALVWPRYSQDGKIMADVHRFLREIFAEPELADRESFTKVIKVGTHSVRDILVMAANENGYETMTSDRSDLDDTPEYSEDFTGIDIVLGRRIDAVARRYDSLEAEYLAERKKWYLEEK